MTRVVLADGTVINDCTIGITASGIWVNAKGMDIVRAAQLFSDPVLTQTMRFEYGDMYDEVKDFTQVSVFNCDDPQVISFTEETVMAIDDGQCRHVMRHHDEQLFR